MVVVVVVLGCRWRCSFNCGSDDDDYDIMRWQWYTTTISFSIRCLGNGHMVSPHFLMLTFFLISYAFPILGICRAIVVHGCTILLLLYIVVIHLSLTVSKQISKLKLYKVRDCKTCTFWKLLLLLLLLLLPHYHTVWFDLVIPYYTIVWYGMCT